MSQFTVTGLDKLKAKAERYEVSERGGLRMRVYPTGRKSFYFAYRYGTQSKRMYLGEYGEDPPALNLTAARKRIQEARQLLEKNIDPGRVAMVEREAERDAETVQQLAHEYLEHHAKKFKRSWPEDKRILDKDILPVLGPLKAKDIRRRDLVKLLDAIEARGAPVAADRTGALISKMFRVGVHRGILDASPAMDLQRRAKGKRIRDRALDVDEIKIFWTKLDSAAMTDKVQAALRFLLITGQRRGELARADWSEFDLSEEKRKSSEIPQTPEPTTNGWNIPAEHAKNGKPHYVPLPDLAVTQLAILAKESKGKGPVLTWGKRPMTARALSRAVLRNMEHFKIPHFVVHDLRRTVATHLRRLSIPTEIVARVLGHTIQGVTSEVYDQHAYEKEKREALEVWEAELKRIIEGRQ